MTPAQMIRAAAALALVLGVGVLTVSAYRYGVNVTLDSIEKQNKEAEDAADQAGTGYDECVASGGVWNFAAGNCRRP